MDCALLCRMRAATGIDGIAPTVSTEREAAADAHRIDSTTPIPSPYLRDRIEIRGRRQPWRGLGRS